MSVLDPAHRHDQASAASGVSAKMLRYYEEIGLVRPLRTLRDSALKVAHEDLAREVEQARLDGKTPTIAPLSVPTSEEIGQVAHAVGEAGRHGVGVGGVADREVVGEQQVPEQPGGPVDAEHEQSGRHRVEGARVTVQKASDKDVYRVRTAGMSREGAVATCERIKAAGGACFVAKN